MLKPRAISLQAMDFHVILSVHWMFLHYLWKGNFQNKDESSFNNFGNFFFSRYPVTFTRIDGKKNRLPAPNKNPAVV